MELFPILVDGTEVDTGQYVEFPDMNKVIADPGLAIALQLRTTSPIQRLVFSKLPGMIPSSTPEMRYLRDYRTHHGVPSHSKDELDETLFAKVAISREQDIDRAIATGTRDHSKLFNPFKIPDSGLTLDERMDAMIEAGDELKKRWNELSSVSVAEGMPIRTVKWAWDLAAWQDYRTSVEEWGRLLDVIEKPGQDGGRNYRFREPFGVTAIFPPYNAPFTLGIFSITSSILAGNSSILKPPSKVPLSTIFLGRLFIKTFLDKGFPPSILQVLTGGGKRMMNRFLTDPRVEATVWYGDSDLGFNLWSKAIHKRVQMAPEVAGSDAFFVWGKDIDLERAAKTIVEGRFLGSGQACLAVKRLFVQRSLHDELIRYLVEEADRLKIGLPSDPEVTLPPVGITALYLLLDQMEDAIAKGAKIETGGYRCNCLAEHDPAGLFYKPTILTGISTDMRMMQEEVFAPALPVLPVDSIDSAITIANSSRFGLRSSVYTDDINLRRRWAKEIQTAGVILGESHVYYDSYMPHLGGYKDSGVIGGKYFSEMLTRMKYVHVGPDVDLV